LLFLEAIQVDGYQTLNSKSLNLSYFRLSIQTQR
jgi:hypothetical protein